MYYGAECQHCLKMIPLVEQLEKEENIKIERLETWHNSENKQKFEKADNGKCGGVPFFINTETGKFICGATDYDSFKKWAKGS